MMYNGDCEVYIIRYFNVWFYLFAKTETDNYTSKRGGHIEETVGSKGDCVVEKTIKVVIKDESK